MSKYTSIGGIDMTKEPPDHITDRRGIKTKDYLVVGYAGTKAMPKKKTPSTLRVQEKAGFGYKGNKRFKAPVKVENIHGWHVLRSDGKVLTIFRRGSILTELKHKQSVWDRREHEDLPD